jgi:hypothetical protein
MWKIRGGIALIAKALFLAMPPRLSKASLLMRGVSRLDFLVGPFTFTIVTKRE